MNRLIKICGFGIYVFAGLAILFAYLKYPEESWMSAIAMTMICAGLYVALYWGVQVLKSGRVRVFIFPVFWKSGLLEGKLIKVYGAAFVFMGGSTTLLGLGLLVEAVLRLLR